MVFHLSLVKGQCYKLFMSEITEVEQKEVVTASCMLPRSIYKTR